MWLRAIGISFDQSHAVEARGGEHGPRLNDRRRQWLLAKHVLACLTGTNGPLRVQAIRQWIVDRVDSWISKQFLVGAVATPHTRVCREPGCLSQVPACNCRHAYRFGWSNANDEGPRDVCRTENAYAKASRCQFLHGNSIVKDGPVKYKTRCTFPGNSRWILREQHHENNRCNADFVHVGWNSSGYLWTEYSHARRFLHARASGYRHGRRHHWTCVLRRRESGSGDRGSRPDRCTETSADGARPARPRAPESSHVAPGPANPGQGDRGRRCGAVGPGGKGRGHADSPAPGNVPSQHTGLRQLPGLRDH